MRAKIHWFRAQSAKPPQEIAGALGFVAWNVARRMLANLRKAGFDLEPGPAYFAFLAEALAFEIQVAWRIAYDRLPRDGRVVFTNALAHDVGRVLAENEAELLGAERADTIAARFLGLLNRRFEEYADFRYDEAGAHFLFLRYFASLVREILPEKDRVWIHDVLIAIEGPEAAAMIAKALGGLLETGPGRRGRATASVGE